jgi:hypothetical protein
MVFHQYIVVWVLFERLVYPRMNTTSAWSGAVAVARVRAEKRSWNFMTSTSVCFFEGPDFEREDCHS